MVTLPVRMSRKPLLVLAAGLLLGLLAASCGGAQEPTATSVPPTATRAPAAQPAPTTAPSPQATAMPAPQPTAAPTPTSAVPAATVAPTRAPAATPPPAAPSGRVNLGVIQVIPPLFVPALGGVGHEQDYASWGIVEFLIYANDKEVLDPGISMAESWQLASDQSKVTFKIRRGVPFHKGYGEVTAADVVWSHNNALREGSTFWGVTGIKLWMDRWEQVDNYTAELYFKKGEFRPTWDITLSNLRTHQPWVYPKRAYDELGEQKANITPLGTGPFQAVSYQSRERVAVEAVVPHWRRAAGIQRLEVFEIPEALARAAAFQTGEADIIEVTNRMIPELQQKVAGSYAQPARGSDFPHVVYYTGNYWAETMCKTGEKIFPRPGFKPDAEHPWIGDPRDPARMESAKKVRQAMSVAIDHNTLLKTVFGGLGTAGGTYTGFLPTDPQWKREWEIPYDKELAKRLLAEAGYPNGFSFTFYVPPDHIVVNPEAGQAIAQMWREIGLDVKIDSTAYAAARPRHFNGQDDIIWYHHSGAGQTDLEKGGNYGPNNTFHGAELPCDVQQLNFANLREPDREKRIQNNVKLQDYISQWWLNRPFVVAIDHFMVGPRIAAWTPHFIPGRYFTAPETLKVK